MNKKIRAKIRTEMKKFIKNAGLEFNGFWRLPIDGGGMPLTETESGINDDGGRVIGRNVPDSVFFIAVDTHMRFTRTQSAEAARLLAKVGCFGYVQSAESGILPVLSKNEIGFTDYIKRVSGLVYTEFK